MTSAVSTAHAIYPSLKGRVVFVTGGAGGIGADIVAGFARNNCRVVFCDLQDGAGAALADHIARSGGEAHYRRCDVVDVEALKAVIHDVGEKIGPIRVLVNNAANDDRHAVDDVDVDYWDNCQNVNLRPHFFAAQAVRPQMCALGGGAIINLSSIAWRLGAGEMPAYATAKAGIVGLTRALARALGPDGIRVNAIEPGAVMTERQRQLWYKTDASVDAMVQRQVLRSVLKGEAIADAALFLASDDARMITKQTLTVDAGLR